MYKPYALQMMYVVCTHHFPGPKVVLEKVKVQSGSFCVIFLGYEGYAKYDCACVNLLH
jgi:hypothetical protein